MKTIKQHYEALLIIITFLSFFLFRKEAFGPNTYMIIGGIIGLYFVPVKMIASIVSIETKQKGMQVMSSLIIVAIIGTSLIAVNNKHVPGLEYSTYTLAGINAFFIMYVLFKDQERKAFLLHLAAMLFISALIDFI